MNRGFTRRHGNAENKTRNPFAKVHVFYPKKHLLLELEERLSLRGFDFGRKVFRPTTQIIPTV